MASPMTSSKRFSVRLALVTSSTVAMIVGAQTLATLDPVSAAPVNNTAAQTVTTTVPKAAPQIHDPAPRRAVADLPAAQRNGHNHDDDQCPARWPPARRCSRPWLSWCRHRLKWVPHPYDAVQPLTGADHELRLLYATNFHAMGCTVNLWLETSDDGPALLIRAAQRIADVEATLSRFRPESELSRLNTEVGAWRPVSDMLLDNVRTAKQGARLTGGLYNPLVLDSLERAVTTAASSTSTPPGRRKLRRPWTTGVLLKWTCRPALCGCPPASTSAAWPRAGPPRSSADELALSAPVPSGYWRRPGRARRSFRPDPAGRSR